MVPVKIVGICKTAKKGPKNRIGGAKKGMVRIKTRFPLSGTAMADNIEAGMGPRAGFPVPVPKIPCKGIGNRDGTSESLGGLEVVPETFPLQTKTDPAFAKVRFPKPLY